MLALGLSLGAPVSTTVAADEVSVAFLGDQGIGDNARAVLELVKNEGVDLLLLQGDLGYDGRAREWITLFESVFPGDFPVLSSAGNHDRVEWTIYRSWLNRRIDAAPDVDCRGDIGVKAHCRFRGLSVVQSAPGIRDVSPVGLNDDYAGYIDAQFDGNPAAWRICSFHKVQTAMQVGDQQDSVGWGVYEACLRAGAIVATAHEHSYARTFLMRSFQQQQVANRDSTLVLEPGRSFAFHAGLGGHDVRAQEQGGDWWASIYTASQGATHGALFCRFGDTKARCEFKSIGGAVPDAFSMETRVGRHGVEAVTPDSVDAELVVADALGEAGEIDEPVEVVQNAQLAELDEPSDVSVEPEAEAQSDPDIAEQSIVQSGSASPPVVDPWDGDASDEQGVADAGDPFSELGSDPVDTSTSPNGAIEDPVIDPMIELDPSPENDAQASSGALPLSQSDSADPDASIAGNPFAVAATDSASTATNDEVLGNGPIRTGAGATGVILMIAVSLTGLRRRFRTRRHPVEAVRTAGTVSPDQDPRNPHRAR